MNEEIVTVLHLRAPNDSNGNPRRLYLGINDVGVVVRVHDEGYAGHPEWVKAWMNNDGISRWPVEITTTPKEYSAFLRMHKDDK